MGGSQGEHLPAFLAAIEATDIGTALSSKVLQYAGGVYVTATTAALDDIFTLLKESISKSPIYVDATHLEQQQDIVDLLDAGAVKLVITPAQYEPLKTVANLDAARLILTQDSIEHTLSTSTSVLFDSESVTLDQLSRLHMPSTVYISRTSWTQDDVIAYAQASVIPIVPAARLSLSKENNNTIDVSTILLARAKSDRSDGLFSTLVTDERGVALGLVYSNAESVAESIRSGRGVYWSRKRGLWLKGDTSGDWQELLRIELDCDHDCLCFTVRQQGKGFCHLQTPSCFGQYRGLSKLQKTLQSRKENAPAGSYTARLFNDPKMLNAKVMEEAAELCEATTKADIAAEAADLLYFALTRAVAAGVTLEDIERNLDAKSVKIKRRKGDAKGPYAEKFGVNGTTTPSTNGATKEEVKEAESKPKAKDDPAGLNAEGRIQMRRVVTSQQTPQQVAEILKRPSQRSTDKIMGIVNPIIKDVRERGDKAVLEYTHKFEKATSLTSPVLKAPFPSELMKLSQATIDAIDLSFDNIKKFHAAQKESKPLEVETMPGVVCSRFSRPIERVGLYVPGGTAVLPSTALMLGVPAMVAGCKKIVIATPPRADGSVTPEIVYVAHKVGAESIVLAGGAQGVAAMAYGTENISKVDKILGPGNQFVTAAKMIVSNDTTASVSIDMPAGPSEVLVIADKTANPAFVASDLLSQAEHGVDSQVICITVGLSNEQVQAIDDELHKQAIALPRVDMVRGAIEHSVTLEVDTLEEAMELSNMYAPEHLILQLADPVAAREQVQNAGSVFVGEWTPESVGDYSAGVNHSLPTYGYAKQYSGVNLASYVKHITSSRLTAEGLRNVGGAVMQLAAVEQLDAHKRAVSIRLEHMAKQQTAQ